MTRIVNWHFVGLILALASFSGTALAEDIAPCWRGSAGATYQSWTLTVSNNPAVPEQWTNTWGTPQASFVVGPYGKGWKNSVFGTRQGEWDLGQNGTITLIIPDQEGLGKTKYLQLQVIFFFGIYEQPAVSIAGGTLLTNTVQVLETVTGMGTWRLLQASYRIDSGASSATVQITSTAKGALIDQIVVDTISVEPVCPGNLTLNADAGSSSKTNVSYGFAYTNGCVVTNVSCTPAQGSTFAIGTTPVTCNASDFMGAQSTCNFSVTVVENLSVGVQLTIRWLGAGQVEVSWPAVEGTVLEGTSTLGTNWTALDVKTVRAGERFSVTVDAIQTRQFLRVRQP